jgi:hypothetical protein
VSETEEVDGVKEYRQNGRSVESLTREQLLDILESFPETSDAYMAAWNQLSYYNDLSNKPRAPKVKDTDLKVNSE